MRYIFTILSEVILLSVLPNSSIVSAEEADSQLVKLVMMTKVFFNNQQPVTSKAKRFIIAQLLR